MMQRKSIYHKRLKFEPSRGEFITIPFTAKTEFTNCAHLISGSLDARSDFNMLESYATKSLSNTRV